MTKFKRKNKPIPSAILTSDWHLREDTPQCRTDDFWMAQEKKIDFIFSLAKQNQCPIIVAGDIGHKPRWSCRLLEWFISKIDKDINIQVIPGQHDLINHRLDLWEQSGIGVLHAAEVINLYGFDKFPCNVEFDNFYLSAFPYGIGIQHIKSLGILKPQIAITHEMIIENQKLWPDQKAPKGNSILKKFPEFSLVHSGDNHNSFVSDYSNNLLVNCGSLMRNSSDQENHKPRIYLWYAETNEIEAVYLPIKQGVISRTHIEVAKNRENRNQAFIKRVNEDVEIQLSYENNLENYFNKYRTEKPVKNKVWQSVEQTI